MLLTLLGVAEDKLAMGIDKNLLLTPDCHAQRCALAQTLRHMCPKRAVFCSSQTGIESKTLRNPRSCLCVQEETPCLYLHSTSSFVNPVLFVTTYTDLLCWNIGCTEDFRSVTNPS